MKAARDSYSRVYNDDGTYSYSRIPQNRLRVAGQEYFENWEITGSKEVDRDGNKKFALTAFYVSLTMDWSYHGFYRTDFDRRPPKN